MLRTIQQIIPFEGAKPEELFDIFMDAKKHGELIGAKVTISRTEGEQFTAFDGFVKGKNLMIVPDRLIVQSWRGDVWEEGDLDSVLVLSFDRTSGGAQIHMIHSELPPQFEERWNELYWEPLRGYFTNRKQ